MAQSRFNLQKYYVAIPPWKKERKVSDKLSSLPMQYLEANNVSLQFILEFYHHQDFTQTVYF